jgi:hypothetical protein
MLDQGPAKETQAKGHLCKPSRNVDSRKSVLAVMLDQGPAKETQAKGHLCKSSRDKDSRKPRALLCKPSRDVDLCKSILAVMLDQGLAKETQEKGHLYKPDGYIWKPNLELAGHGLGNRKEKGKRENWIKGIGTRTRIAQTGEGYQVSLTLVPRTSPGDGQPDSPPHPLHTSTHTIRTSTVTAPRQDAVTSDTMGSWVLTQCAAAMRVTRVANGSSDS